LGFSDIEKTEYQELIYYNIKLGLQELVIQSSKFQFHCATENLKRARFFEDIDLFGEFSQKTSATAHKLWADQAIQNTWKARGSFPLQISNLDYLMDNMDRIMSQGYVPTHEDILRVRQRTTGEKVTNYVIDKIRWEFIDVGGQKPERDKWETILQNKETIDAILYFVAVDEYNLMSKDDPAKTKLEVSYEVWRDLLKNENIKTRNITMILFLNKMDLLEDKLNQEEDKDQFLALFPKYTGNGLEPALDLIKHKFVHGITDFKITTHNTCALDTNLIQFIFKSVQQTIFDGRIRTSGLKF